MSMPQIIVINDLSGFGRCSLSVQLPVLSVLQNEVLMMPTSLLSNHTAYPDFVLRDLAEDIDPWVKVWKTLPVKPSAILSGFISSGAQARGILSVLEAFHKKGVLYVCDPAMADHGKLYSSLDSQIVKEMKTLALQADLLLPNVTEACLLAGVPWHERWSLSQLQDLVDVLWNQGLGSRMVITGIETEDGLLGDLVVENRILTPLFFRPIYPSRCGTGDLFSATITGYLLQGTELVEAVQKTQAFIQAALKVSVEDDTDPREGCEFEKVLGMLMN